MLGATLDGTTVLICDWHGRVVWISSDDMLVKRDDFAWEHLAIESREKAQVAIARAVTMREQAALEVKNNFVLH